VLAAGEGGAGGLGDVGVGVHDLPGLGVEVGGPVRDRRPRAVRNGGNRGRILLSLRQVTLNRTSARRQASITLAL
jgi:hypothetical protein